MIRLQLHKCVQKEGKSFASFCARAKGHLVDADHRIRCPHAVPPAKTCAQADCNGVEYGQEVLKEVNGLQNREIVHLVHGHANIDDISIANLTKFIKKQEYSLSISTGVVAKTAVVKSTPAPP